MKPFSSPPAISLITLIAAAGALLSACNLTAASPPTPVDAAPAYTAAAQTIIAELTGVAETQLAAGTPFASPLPSESATQAPRDTPTAAPTDAPTANATPTATASPTASPTVAPPASDPRTYLGAPSFVDSFGSDQNWSLYDDEHVSFEIKNDQMVMTAFNPDSWESWTLSWPVISDFYLEMSAAVEQCSGGDRYGMMARAQQSDLGYLGYLLGITCDGRYSLRRWDGENFVTIVDWTGSEYLRPGSNQANRIGLMADGKKLSVYLNGNLVKEMSDDNHLSGKFGVSVGSAKTPDFTVLVDEIAYWELP